MRSNKPAHLNEFFTSSIVGTPFQLNLEATSETIAAPKRLQGALSFDSSRLVTTKNTHTPQKPLHLTRHSTAQTPLPAMEKAQAPQTPKTKKSDTSVLWLLVFLLFLTLLLLGIYTWK